MEDRLSVLGDGFRYRPELLDEIAILPPEFSGIRNHRPGSRGNNSFMKSTDATMRLAQLEVA